MSNDFRRNNCHRPIVEERQPMTCANHGKHEEDMYPAALFYRPGRPTANKEIMPDPTRQPKKFIHRH